MGGKTLQATGPTSRGHAREGGARTELTVRLNARGPETPAAPEDTVQLIRRLAAHHPDHQIAAILTKNGSDRAPAHQLDPAPSAGMQARILAGPIHQHPGC